MSSLLLESVSHRFDSILAVDNLTLTVEQNELVCLLGPSGCGKSTALRIAAGLEHLQAGRVKVADQVMADAATGRDVPPEQRGVGLVFQDYALFPHLSVAENVAFGLTGLDRKARAARTEAALAAVNMRMRAGDYPHTLSGGEQQRVALARALAPEPRMILLDEPFSGLDKRLREQVRDQTLHVLKQSGAATLLVTHDPEEAMFMADRIAVMRQGRIVQAGTPVELYFHPHDAFVAGFLGEVNRIHRKVVGANAATPFGDIPAAGLPEGSPVEVLIRPEALRISELGGAGPTARGARVMAARLLGRTSLIHLEVEDGDRGNLHLHSRMPGRFLPDEGAWVEIDLDPSQAFVFPQEGSTEVAEDA